MCSFHHSCLDVRRRRRRRRRISRPNDPRCIIYRGIDFRMGSVPISLYLSHILSLCVSREPGRTQRDSPSIYAGGRGIRGPWGRVASVSGGSNFVYGVDCLLYSHITVGCNLLSRLRCIQTRRFECIRNCTELYLNIFGVRTLFNRKIRVLVISPVFFFATCSTFLFF